jgi:hypothetical protein
VLRKLMVLLWFLAAMMLVASPVLAWQPGPGEGNKYSKNYYPTSFYKYCEPGGSKYYGNTKAANPRWCDRTPGYGNYYTEYQKKTKKNRQWYRVHVYFKWRTPDGKVHKREPWFLCQYHKYHDPNSTHPYFRAWVTYKPMPTGNHYWESFYWHR